MNLPSQYQWLCCVDGLPNTIKRGLEQFGVREIVGKGNSATIMDWRDKLNGAAPAGKPIVSGYSSDEIAWCGLFVAFICWLRTGVIGEVVRSPLWARNWANYGVGVAVRKNGKLVSLNGLVPSLGDILVFERGDGGHVGFYIGEDDTTYHILGGNQSNMVCIVRIEKKRLLNVRRPPYKTTPAGATPRRLSGSGLISTNEA
jgi:uncharacterized protein (TIGR02594 family)